MDIQAFAETHIAPLCETLQKQKEFPKELWKTMGENGLLGLGIPDSSGGSGFDYSGLSRAGFDLMNSGGCLGLCLSWMIHQIMARFVIAEFASGEIQTRLLPEMATGKRTGSMAVSEPGTGPHPKYMKTAMELSSDNSTFTLSGEKTYLTNGPVADFFVVIGKSGEKNGRNLISACLVPKETQGLTVLPAMEIPFLKPAPHGGIRLHECRVSAETHRIGKIHEIYDPLVMGFRTIENVLMMGIVAGAVARQTRALVYAMPRNRLDMSPETSRSLGKLLSTRDVMEVLSIEAAGRLDCSASDPGIISGHSIFKGMAAEYQTLFTSLSDTLPKEKLPADILGTHADLTASSGLGKQADDAALRKMVIRTLSESDTTR